MFRNHLTLSLADNLISANETDDHQWHVNLVDCFSGKRHEVMLTNDQFAQMIALTLGVGEDKTPGFDAEMLYRDVLPALGACPEECRPMP